MNFSCGQKAGHGTPGLIKNPNRTKFFMYLLSLLQVLHTTGLLPDEETFDCLQSDGALTAPSAGCADTVRALSPVLIESSTRQDATA